MKQLHTCRMSLVQEAGLELVSFLGRYASTIIYLANNGVEIKNHLLLWISMDYLNIPLKAAPCVWAPAQDLPEEQIPLRQTFQLAPRHRRLPCFHWFWIRFPYLYHSHPRNQACSINFNKSRHLQTVHFWWDAISERRLSSEWPGPMFDHCTEIAAPPPQGILSPSSEYLVQLVHSKNGDELDDEYYNLGTFWRK